MSQSSLHHCDGRFIRTRWPNCDANLVCTMLYEKNKYLEMFIPLVGRQFSFWNGPFSRISRDVVFRGGGGDKLQFTIRSFRKCHKKPVTVGIRWYQTNEPLVLVGVWVIERNIKLESLNIAHTHTHHCSLCRVPQTMAYKVTKSLAYFAFRLWSHHRDSSWLEESVDESLKSDLTCCSSLSRP